MSAQATVENKFFAHVLRDLTQKKHNPYNLPFLQPVDAIALGIPHYLDIIKKPMDLSTIRFNLEQGEYETCERFEADIRLMFQNCYAFNPIGTDVFLLGTQLENAFNIKWAEKNHFIQQQSGAVGRLGSSSAGIGGYSDYDSGIIWRLMVYVF